MMCFKSASELRQRLARRWCTSESLCSVGSLGNMSRSEFVCVSVCVVWRCSSVKSDSSGSVRFGHGSLPKAVRVLRVVYDGFINC
jgi:hypothetical protein